MIALQLPADLIVIPGADPDLLTLAVGKVDLGRIRLRAEREQTRQQRADRHDALQVP